MPAASLGLIAVRDQDGVVCQPGTHAKWARIEAGRIAGFATWLTGEAFAALRSHIILGRLMADAPHDAAAFARGVMRSGEPGGMLHHLFGVRTLGLMDRLPPGAAPSYLSGLLIVHEVRAAPTAAPIRLIGAPDLCARYEEADAALGGVAHRDRRRTRHRRPARPGGTRPMDLRTLLHACPLVAILRGIRPGEIEPVGDALAAAGLRIIEAPLNSPDPMESIARLARRLGDRVLVGAGTVMRPADVDAIADAGGRVSSHPTRTRRW